MTGDQSWVLVAVENIKQQCLVTVEFDISYWIPDTDGLPNLPSVVNTICPNDCSGNGKCVKGECACLCTCLFICLPIFPCLPAGLFGECLCPLASLSLASLSDSVALA